MWSILEVPLSLRVICILLKQEERSIVSVFYTFKGNVFECSYVLMSVCVAAHMCTYL